MLTTKNTREDEKSIIFQLRFLVFTLLVAGLAVALVGCGPPGTHALLKGQKLLEEGDYADAADEFRTATQDMSTNAEAWNYLGVAEQHAGQLDEAVNSYQKALELDRDLTEAHFNLGTLWMQEGKTSDAISEFTAYTLRRVNEPDGWLKLGVAQLRNKDILSAEKSFSTAHYLSPNNAEALNGLGLARMQRGRPQEAEKFFQAAVQNHPDYAPAILNLATVEHEYLHNDHLALDEYRAYLALDPRPANWDDVNAIVNSMEQSPNIAMAAPPQTQQNPPAWQNSQNTVSPEPASPREQETRQQEKKKEHKSVRTEQAADMNQQPTETVEVQPHQQVAVAPSPTLRPATEPEAYRSVTPIPPPGQSSNQGGFSFFHWIHPHSSQSNTAVTPLPPENESAMPPPERVIVQPAPPVFPRYLYSSPRKPEAGDRHAASVMFTHARDYEAQRRFTEALDSYRRAAQLDPSWFEAQYNCGVMAYRLRDYQFSLAAYETALAIEPDSPDARYNFALALKAAGYVPDAVNELRKILESNPNDARAHLELGNLYSQQLRDIPRARTEYLQVLQLDPGNPQASNIEFWLSAHPQ